MMPWTQTTSTSMRYIDLQINWRLSVLLELIQVCLQWIFISISQWKTRAPGDIFQELFSATWAKFTYAWKAESIIKYAALSSFFGGWRCCHGHDPKQKQPYDVIVLRWKPHSRSPKLAKLINQAMHSQSALLLMQHGWCG
jgi:hypothetical protein